MSSKLVRVRQSRSRHRCAIVSALLESNLHFQGKKGDRILPLSRDLQGVVRRVHSDFVLRVSEVLAEHCTTAACAT